MAKNPRRAAKAAPSVKSTVSSPLFSPRGKKLLACGGITIVLGFATLTLTDPAGRNWASMLSPALLVLGYTLVGVGISSTASDEVTK